jgi:hypothetical protein
MYSDLQETVREQLAEVEVFSLTTDMWTSVQMDPYMGITVHFINAHWDLESLNLGAFPFSDDHTGDNIAQEITTILEEWRLPLTKLVCGTTDNASNNNTCFRALGKPRLPCFGHNLDLAVGKALKLDDVAQAVRLTRKAVTAFSTSWKRRRDLKTAQKTTNTKEQMLIHVNILFYILL